MNTTNSPGANLRASRDAVRRMDAPNNEHESGRNLRGGVEKPVGRVSTRQVGCVNEVKSEPRMNANEHECSQDPVFGLLDRIVLLFLTEDRMRWRVGLTNPPGADWRASPKGEAQGRAAQTRPTVRSQPFGFLFVFIRVHSWFKKGFL